MIINSVIAGKGLVINRGKTYIGMTTFEYREELILN